MNNKFQFLVYNMLEENVSVKDVIKEKTIWLIQKAMSALFEIGVPAISKHLKNIFIKNELSKKAVVSILEKTTQHGTIEGRIE